MHESWTPDKANLTPAKWLEAIDFVVFKDKREQKRLLSRIDIEKVELTDLLSRLSQEKKKERNSNIALSVAAVSAVTVFGIILSL